MTLQAQLHPDPQMTRSIYGSDRGVGVNTYVPKMKRTLGRFAVSSASRNLRMLHRNNVRLCAALFAA